MGCDGIRAGCSWRRRLELWDGRKKTGWFYGVRARTATAGVAGSANPGVGPACQRLVTGDDGQTRSVCTTTRF
jgi:hypothetical protein